jgi:hypothetical protein
MKDARKLAHEKAVKLLEDHVTYLQKVDISPDNADGQDDQDYHIPSDIVSPSEQAEFENVYQIHCPKLFLNTAIRDVCSF